MQKLLFTFFVLILAMPTFGQNPGDLKVSLGTGLYNAKLVESTPRSFYSFDMDYHVSQKHVLSAGFLKAKVFYLDTEWTNVPLEDTWWWWNEKNNAKFETYNFAVL